MITYFRTRKGSGALERYARTYDPRLLERVREVDYAALFDLAEIPRGLVVFSDLERMGAPQRALAGRLYDALAEEGDRLVVVNDPRRTLSVYEQLRAFREGGLSRVGAYRLHEIGRQVRYPVSLQVESGPQGARTPLLENEHEVAEWAARWAFAEIEPCDLVAIEHDDTAQAKGDLRRFTAQRVGGTVISLPALADSHDEPTFGGARIETDAIAEKPSCVSSGPHAEQLMEVFQVAHVEYGLVHYALHDGAIQVGEINTNPDLMPPSERLSGERKAMQLEFAARCAEALLALDEAVQPGPPVSLQLDPLGLGS